MIKKIAAVGCALTMAVSMMSMEAGATNWNLRYTSVAPSSSNKLSHSITVVASNQGYLYSNCTSYNIPSSDVWVRTTAHLSDNYDRFSDWTDVPQNGWRWYSSFFERGQKFDLDNTFLTLSGDATTLSNYVNYANASGYYK